MSYASTMIYFVTGNPNKAREVQEILGQEVTHIPLDLPEIQSVNSMKILERKIAAALEQTDKRPLLVEDNALCFNTWQTPEGYLPGPLIKHFLSLGLERIVRMISPFPNKSAFAINYLAYADITGKVKYITGAVDGTIVAPRGTTGFGWDPIFQPGGHEQTFAEMDAALKNRISHRRVAIDNLRAYLSSRQ